MPRLVYWNVQDFGYNKFICRKRPRAKDEKREYGVNPVADYRNILLNTITANDPDFIVIVEANPGGDTGAGTLLTDRSAVELLGRLRAKSTRWAMVPPVISGLAKVGEGVLVYFRRSPTLFFTGPWHWPGGNGPAVAAVAPVAPGAPPPDYPAPYDTAFSSPPSPRTVPAGSNYNANQVERQLAGQWCYFTVGGGGAGGAAPITFGIAGSRSPFRVTFYDTAAAPPRNYSILGCHCAPGQDLSDPAVAPSTLATAAVGTLHEVQNIGANETVVVVGDFNVSLFESHATAVAYAPFTGAHYTQVINWLPPHPMPDSYPSRGYLITHIKEGSRASPSWTDSYPAFGYMSEREKRWQYDSIDNAFVRGGHVANPTIANIVSGAPYNPPGVPTPTDVPTGTLGYDSVLKNPLALNVPTGYDPDGDNFYEETELFQDIDNYGRAYDVSDHLPLVFDF